MDSLKRIIIGCVLSLSAVIASALPCRADPVAGQKDDFQDGTTQGWSNGPGAPDPINLSTGGPAGAGDHWLKVSAKGGIGSGAKLTVFNKSPQWTGDFTKASTASVEMDLMNVAGTPLSMRIAFKSGATGYSTKTAFALPDDGAWHHASFGLSDADLTRVTGSAAVEDALKAVDEFRILHSATPTDHGDSILGSFGVDNILAVAGAAVGGVQRPSDLNGDGSLDLSDAVFLLTFLFLGGAPPLPCGDGTAADAGNVALLDANGDGLVDASDTIAVLEYLFIGKAPPVLGATCRVFPGCPDNAASCSAGG